MMDLIVFNMQITETNSITYLNTNYATVSPTYTRGWSARFISASDFKHLAHSSSDIDSTFPSIFKTATSSNPHRAINELLSLRTELEQYLEDEADGHETDEEISIFEDAIINELHGIVGEEGEGEEEESDEDDHSLDLVGNLESEVSDGYMDNDGWEEEEDGDEGEETWDADDMLTIISVEGSDGEFASNYFEDEDFDDEHGGGEGDTLAEIGWAPETGPPAGSDTAVQPHADDGVRPADALGDTASQQLPSSKQEPVSQRKRPFPKELVLFTTAQDLFLLDPQESLASLYTEKRVVSSNDSRRVRYLEPFDRLNMVEVGIL